MAGRIVLFGATGYTGRLIAEALVLRGVRPVLAGRSADKLGAQAEALGGLDHQVADVARPQTVRGLVERGDVLVSTVGPFSRHGGPAVEAAVDAGAHYLDSTGEASFIREVFQRHGPRARERGCALVPALGFDYLPGNLAGAHALRQAGPPAVWLEIGYFVLPLTRRTFSAGTLSSILGEAATPAHTWRDGQLVLERPARRVRRYLVDGRRRPAGSIGSTEHFTLPEFAAGLRGIDVHLGWFGPFTRVVQANSAVTAAAVKMPGVGSLLDRGAARATARSSGEGPDADTRTRTRSHVVAVARNSARRALSEVRLSGPEPYGLTAQMLAWAAQQAAAGRLEGHSGALGPVQAFGLEELTAACDEAGLRASGGLPRGRRVR